MSTKTKRSKKSDKAAAGKANAQLSSTKRAERREARAPGKPDTGRGLSGAEFVTGAGDLVVGIESCPAIKSTPREFSTGSKGWNVNGVVALDVPEGAESYTALRPLFLTVDGQAMTAEPKEFRSGSYGWRAQGKVFITTPLGRVKCQASFNLVLHGTKDGIPLLPEADCQVSGNVIVVKSKPSDDNPEGRVMMLALRA